MNVLDSETPFEVYNKAYASAQIWLNVKAVIQTATVFVYYTESVKL